MTSKSTAPDEPKPISEIKDATLRDRLDSLCSTYRVLAEQKAEAEKMMEKVKKGYKDDGGEHVDGIDDLVKHPSLARFKRVVGDGWLLTKVAGRKTLSKEKLVEKGVSAKIINMCYTQGPDYYMVKGRDED